MSYNLVTVKFQLHATQHSLLIIPLRVLHNSIIMPHLPGVAYCTTAYCE